MALIAAVRGLPVKRYGAMDLPVRDAHGERGSPRRMMRADRAMYPRPWLVKPAGAGGMMVGRHNYPDVVLDAGRTTDVRLEKLKLCESWGFPKSWVEVAGRAVDRGA